MAAWLHERKGQLEGEVFVVTKGGQNYKLGLVQIALFPMETLQPNLNRKKSEAEAKLQTLKPRLAAAKAEKELAERAERAALEAMRSAPLTAVYAPLADAVEKAHQHKDTASRIYDALLVEQRGYLLGRYYFDALPKPIVRTQTNSDGKFAIEVPTKQQFAIAATAERIVGDSTERYYWLIKVSLDGAPKKTIMLSNNNLSSEASPDSLIVTIN